MSSRANAQEMIRRWEFEVDEEAVGHARVVVLPCVDQQLIDSLSAAKCSHDRRNLHEIRSGSDHVEDLHGSAMLALL